MKKLSFTLFTLFFSFSMTAQITFEKSYNMYNSAFADLVFSQEDGYIMAMIGLKDKYYLSLVKTNHNGDTVWTKDHDLIVTTVPSDIIGAEDAEGNIYISSQAAGYKLLKFNSDGNLIWSKNYSSTFSKMLVKNNTVYACSSLLTGCYLYRIATSTGDSLWRSNIFANETMSKPTSMVVLDNGEIVVTVSPVNGFDYTLGVTEYFKLTGNSNTLVKFSLPTDKEIVIRDSRSIGNEIISVGNIINNFSIEKTCYFLRYTADGTIVSLKEEIFDYYYAYLQRCLITNQNQVIALGYNSMGGTNNKLMLHCFSMNGDSLWTQLLGNKDVLGWDIELANDGGFVVTGGLKLSGDVNHPYLLKTNSLGTLNAINEKNHNSMISAYPNPASDYVMFSHPNSLSGIITIIDANGKLCNLITINGKSTIWYTDQIKPGLYFYQIESNNSKSSGRIVIH